MTALTTLLAAAAVLVASVLLTVLYMVVYGTVINPGHPQSVYDAHVQAVGPYLSIVFGAPLMYLACRYVARRVDPAMAIRAALSVWGIYVVIDGALLVASGALATASTEVRIVAVLSQLAKLVAAYVAARGVIAARTT